METKPDLDEIVNWVDLRAGDVRVVLGNPVAGDVSRHVIVTAARRLSASEAAALSSVGFSEVAGVGMTRQGARFTLGEMRAAFPGARAVQVPRRQTHARSEPRAAEARPAEPAPTIPSAAPRMPPMRPPVPEPVAREAPTPPPPAPLRPPQAPPSAPLPVERPARAPRNDRPPQVARDARPPKSEPVAEAAPGSRLNAFQNKYEPASKSGEPSAAIPVNLASATKAALARLEETKGGIDAYVAKALGWDVPRMAQALSPEQVDAVGLALFASEEDRDFVLADMTGFGKGRVLAAIARTQLLRKKNVVFLTEKENLFSDFFRDISDIGSLDAFGRPFIVNDGAEITKDGSVEREIMHPAWRKQEVQAALKAGKAPKGTRLVMASYSQFNRKGSVKSEFLKAVAKGAHVLLDESHNAVGDSNTSEAIGEAIEEAASVTNSSATFARGAQNLAAYKRLFPSSMRSSDLMSVLATGGQALSEALSTMLAESGSYLRREHDLSSIKVEVVEDAKRLDRNRAYADSLSPVLAGIARLARMVNDVVDERNGPGDENAKRKSKELWTAGNFGSRLAAVMRQFVTCLKVDMVVEDCVDALSQGIKPVVVIESTMESLMRELASDKPDEGEGAEQVEIQVTADDEAEADREIKDPPTFRDALRLFIDRTMTISVRRPGQKDPEKVPLDDPALVREADDVRALVDLVPDLTMSPIDDLRARVEGMGEARGKPWRVEEISARSMRIVGGRYAPMPARDRNTLVAGFQAGQYDALVITRAASTGLSLHASEKVADKRQRCMIELQIASNVVERMQFFGRVNRRGQVSSPFFRTTSTGLPLENRQLAMQNRKLADLSANVTGAAQNASAMDVPDIIDSVGNAVCRRLLEDRPSLADRMHIAMRLPDPEKAEGELYHVNKVLQRLCLLPSEEQEAVYAGLLKAYEAEVKDLATRGSAPGGAREIPGEWTVVGRETFEAGDRRDGPIFGRPVTVTTIERTEERSPPRSQDVVRMVQEATAKLPKVGGEVFGEHVKMIKQALPRLQQRALPQRFANYREALADSRPNPVKDVSNRVDALVNLLRVVRPGSPITVSGEDGKELGIVTAVRPPSSQDDVATPSMWRVSYVVAGVEGTKQISVAGINGDPGTSVGAFNGTVAPALLAAFDRAPAGATKVVRKILDGNLVRAVITARHQKWNTAVTWRDDAGVPRRGVLVPRNKQSTLGNLPGRTTDPEAALAVLNAGGSLWTNRDSPEDGAQVSEANRTLTAIFPVKKGVSKLFETPGILGVTGPLRGGQKERYAEMPLSSASRLVAALAEAGHAFHFDGQYRDDAARAVADASQAADEEAAYAPSP